MLESLAAYGKDGIVLNLAPLPTCHIVVHCMPLCCLLFSGILSTEAKQPLSLKKKIANEKEETTYVDHLVNLCADAGARVHWAYRTTAALQKCCCEGS